ncbi:hypothetical protein TRFO_06299 [Tritrichomonas foetus]|uniref:Uncharacterized protein n=1 Tax=Tritrichomonas foetus TaxID=1144522 RepID=A0A1J4K0E3_9EUKA|nr:hypothetical protein TRFO_06299 [Tritrichomonas foetus]|eukprot:OHT04418.1 hypothetical protein TRFO_06299 [Tritrichomonas foetus]
MNVDNNQQSSEPTISYAIICFVNSQNNETIESINNFLVNQMKNHPKLFIKEVAKMICDESLEDRIYRYLLTIFSNAISTRQRPLGFFMSQWRSIFCEDEIISLHNQLIHFLESDDFNLRVYSSWCIARLVNFELPLGIWPNFFQWLFETLLSPSFQDNIFLFF